MNLVSASKTQNAYDVWAATYDRERPPHTYLEERHVLDLLSASDSDLILDAACGTGRYAAHLCAVGARVIGCDISNKMVDAARLNAPKCRFVQADLNDTLPFADGTFTKIVCSLALRHVERLTYVLAQFYRVAAPGAKLVFSTIHPEMDWSTYERSVPSSIEVNDEAVTFPYTQTELLNAAQEAAWRVDEQREIVADESIEPYLTRESFLKQVNSKYVFIVSLLK